MNKNTKLIISDPLIDNNPITRQVLGICSALAVTVRVENAIVMSLALMFLSVVLDTTVLYLIVTLLAAMTGFLYNFLITDIGHLEKKHHILAMITVPFVALFNLVLIIIISNTLIVEMGLISPHNPWIIGVLFAVVFLIPLVIDKLVLSKKKI